MTFGDEVEVFLSGKYVRAMYVQPLPDSDCSVVSTGTTEFIVENDNVTVREY